MKRLMNHGTMAAVRRHQREKSRLCDACREEQRSRDTQRRCKAEKPAEPEKPKVDLSASLARMREYLDARHATEQENRCCVGDHLHLELVCTCGGFSEADPAEAVK